MKNKNLKKHHTQQLDQSDCGGVCLQTILKIMKELSVNKLENLEGGKFWGKTCNTYEIVGKCYENCKVQRFWIVTRRTFAVPCGTS